MLKLKMYVRRNNFWKINTNKFDEDWNQQKVYGSQGLFMIKRLNRIGQW